MAWLKGTAVSGAGQEEPLAPVETKYPGPSPLSAYNPPPRAAISNRTAPVVWRLQNMSGTRYLYVRGAVRMPLSQVGVPGPAIGNAVDSSIAQPMYQGFIHDAGFYDALYRAGYPGYNLGLTFKVEKLPVNKTGGPGFDMRMRSSMVQNKLTNTGRAATRPNQVG